MIKFNLTTELQVPDGADIITLGNLLQNFTDYHLYIDDNYDLRGVEKLSDIEYGECELLEYNNGFLLEEKGTENRILCFSKKLMYYLTLEQIKKNIESLNECEDENYKRLYEIEEHVEEKSDIVPTFIEPFPIHSTEFEETVSTEFQSIVSSDSQEEIIDSQEEIIDSQEEIIDSQEEIIDSQEEIIKSDFTYISFYRLFLKDAYDDEEMYTTYINPKILKQIEKDDDIDLEDTIKISFETFIKNKEYDNVNVCLVFFDDTYAEVKIETTKPLDEDLIKEIEDNAIFQLDNKDEIYFIFRKTLEIIESEYDTESELDGDSIIIHDDKYYDPENNYVSEVKIFNLPESFLEKIVNKVKYVVQPQQGTVFLFNDHIFTLFLEKDSVTYSIIDHDNYFKELPRLHPSLYNNQNYENLPIAQFKLE